MENVWFLASLWVGLALIATLPAIWLKISTALSEIVVGTVAQLIVGVAIGRGSLGGSSGAVRAYGYVGREGWYDTLMMSTGLTFGTISALFGLNHRIIWQAQYSYLVATVIGSAVVPAVIANAFFIPSHLLSAPPLSEVTAAIADALRRRFIWIDT